MNRSINKKLEHLLSVLEDIDISEMSYEEVRSFLQAYSSNSQLVDEAISQARRKASDDKRGAA